MISSMSLLPTQLLRYNPLGWPRHTSEHTLKVSACASQAPDFKIKWAFHLLLSMFRFLMLLHQSCGQSRTEFTSLGCKYAAHAAQRWMSLKSMSLIHCARQA